MNWILRSIVACGITILMLWPEWERYQAEHVLAGGGRELDAVLTGQVRGAEAITLVQQVRARAQLARSLVSGDPRADLYEGIAALLLGDLSRSEVVFEQAIALGERPEHLLNYGRVRSAQGDEASARQAFARVLWAAPAAASSLPATLRADLASELLIFEADLRAGRVAEPLPLPESLSAR